jgi:molybdopterin molybdotransferase
MLIAAVKRFGADAIDYGIIKDDEAALREAVVNAADMCDIILLSGGSSAGTRDLTARVIESEGDLLFHGIAMKPGKPTILGIINEIPIFGLPGHPVAAYLVTELFVRPLIAMQMGAMEKHYTTRAILAEAISSNHGREEYVAVRLVDGVAHPVRGKSGLIANLAGVDGYICVPRDCEGLTKGTEVKMIYFLQ